MMDMARHRVYDILGERFLSWIFWMIKAGRLWGLHLCPPCTTFSIARTVRGRKERSSSMPYGEPPVTKAIMHGNALFNVCLGMIMAIHRRGWGWAVFEHPKSAYSWKVPFWSKFCSGDGTA